MPKRKIIREKNLFANQLTATDTTLIIDYHEPEDIIRELTVLLGADNVRVEKLETSDYMIGKVGFERKKDDITNMQDVMAKCMELKSQFPVAVLIVEYNLDDVVRLAIGRKYHRNAVIGMFASLIARGIIPVFAGNKRNLIDLMLAIGAKCNDGKDRTYIDPLRPMADESDYQVRALKGLGLGRDVSERLLLHFGSLANVINKLYIVPILDDDTKRAFKLNGMDAKVEKAIGYIEGRFKKRQSI